jgi:hypothetical protein
MPLASGAAVLQTDRQLPFVYFCKRFITFIKTQSSASLTAKHCCTMLSCQSAAITNQAVVAYFKVLSTADTEKNYKKKRPDFGPSL